MLIDDYKAEGAGISLDQLLRLLDRYAISGETKGGHVNLSHKFTFLTSTLCPEGMFPAHGTRNVAQIQRRLAMVVQVFHSEPAELLVKRILEAGRIKVG